MRKLLSFLGSAVLITLIFFIVARSFFHFSPTHPVIELEKGWTVSYHNQQYQNTNLESMNSQVGETFNRGDVITLSQSQLLSDMNVAFPYLVFKTQYCAFEVYLDDVLIRREFMDSARNNFFVGTGYSFIDLPENYPGKRITIKLFVTENSTKADILTPMVGDFEDLYRLMISTAIFPFCTGLFLILFGTVFMIISLLFSMRSSGLTTQALCSFLTMALGFWILAAYDMFDFIFAQPVSTTLGFCFLYMILPLMYLIIWDMHRRMNNTVITLLTLSSIIFSLLFMGLHFLGIVHINHFQFPYYLVALWGIITLIVYDYADIKRKVRNSSIRILMIGLTILAMSLVVYAIAALTNRIADYRQNRILINSVPIGAVFFVFAQLLNYFIFMTHSFAQKKEYAALTKIAYFDNLTGLANRVRCDEKMIEFDKLQEDFCILSLDLNGLKEVNDNSGHPAGDRLLKSFADTLAEVFSKKGFCTRIGGDEFLVLIKTIEEKELKDMLKELDEKLLILDKEDQEINHSVSYGYAYRHETKEQDTHSVTMLADQRMYDYKRNHYAHMSSR